MDGNWGDWSHWDTCSSSCNGGTQSRMRFCDNPPPSTNGGAKCSGGNGTVQVDSAQCNPNYCGKLLFGHVDDIFSIIHYYISIYNVSN